MLGCSSYRGPKSFPVTVIALAWVTPIRFVAFCNPRHNRLTSLRKYHQVGGGGYVLVHQLISTLSTRGCGTVEPLARHGSR